MDALLLPFDLALFLRALLLLLLLTVAILNVLSGIG
jgi:hypothetical protein